MKTRSLVAGRGLDALVAEEVMGWMRRGNHDPIDDPAEWRMPNGIEGEEVPPCYSTSIASAWEVVEILRERRIFLRVSPLPQTYDVQRWDEEQWVETTEADTASLAICLAALKAVGANEQTGG